MTQSSLSAAAVGHQPLAAVGRDAIRRYLKKIDKQMRHVDEGETGEAVHKLRVATRGLRATLEMLEATPALDQDDHPHALRRRLKRLTSALGEVRDLDVFIERVTAFTREHPERPDALQPLRVALSERREAANTRLQRELERGRTHRLLRDLRHLARDPTDTDGAKQPVILVRHVAGSAIWQRYEEVLAFEGAMPDAPIETLHALRIACKHLRYVVELFDRAEQAEKHPILVMLRTAQDYLGQLHDDAVALATIDEVRAANPDDSTLFVYAEQISGERDSLCRGVAAHWERITGATARHQLASFIAAL